MDGEDLRGTFTTKLQAWLDLSVRRRARLVSVLSARCPRTLKNRHTGHSFALLSLLILVINVFRGTHQLNLFSFHALFMSMAFLVFIPEGVIAYRNHFLLEALGPIMSHGEKTKNRTIHATLQIFGASFAGLGLLFIFANKLKHHFNVLPRSLHAIMGTLLACLLGTQIVIGLLKYQALTTGVVVGRNQTNIRYRWHGKVGLLIYDMGMVTLLLGIQEFFGFCLSLLLCTVLISFLWLNIHIQMLDSAPGLGSGGVGDGMELSSSVTGKLSPKNSDPSMGGGGSSGGDGDAQVPLIISVSGPEDDHRQL